MYYLYNIHGDVIGLADTTGNITKTYNYDAFGVELNLDSEDTNPFRCCGEYYDKETDSIYLRARYYNPALGRFTTEDPVKDGLNWYIYCDNNPIMFIDPSGLDSYIYYLKEWEDEALSDKQNLIDSGISENEIVLIPVNSAEDLKIGWNCMGKREGKEVSIDYVIINTHGNPEKLSGNFDFTTYDIDSLDNKFMKGLIIYGCNAGHLDYERTNPAAAFSKKVNGALVIASDGTVEANHSDEIYTSCADDEFYYWAKSNRDNKGWIIYNIRYFSTTMSAGIKDLSVQSAYKLINDINESREYIRELKKSLIG